MRVGHAGSGCFFGTFFLFLLGVRENVSVSRNVHRCHRQCHPVACDANILRKVMLIMSVIEAEEDGVICVSIWHLIPS